MCFTVILRLEGALLIGHRRAFKSKYLIVKIKSIGNVR